MTMTTPDARAAWNAVQRLVDHGDRELAGHLKRLLEDHRMDVVLTTIAEEQGHVGGLRSAEQAAHESLA